MATGPLSRVKTFDRTVVKDCISSADLPASGTTSSASAGGLGRDRSGLWRLENLRILASAIADLRIIEAHVRTATKLSVVET
jgi:hypothetical protein